MRRFLCVLILLFVSAGAASAQAPPTPDEVERVLSYYYQGEGQAPILWQLQLCEDVPRSGENRLGCEGEVGLSDLTVGTAYDLRMVFLVPEGMETDDVLVQYNRGGITRATDDVTLSGSLRYRTWTTFTPRDPGEWILKVLYDSPDGVQTLQELTVTVRE